MSYSSNKSVHEIKKRDQSLISMPVSGEEELSRETLAFKKKIAKIEKLEAFNLGLAESLQSISLQVLEMVSPIVKEICEKKVENISILEFQMKKKFFRKGEKEKIRLLIIEAADHLYDSYGDARGKEFAFQHMTKKEVKDIEDKESDILDVIDELKQYEQQQNRSAGTQEENFRPGLGKKNVSSKQEKIDLESKTIYRSLMKSLHPDLEQNEDKKNEKKEATQKVAEAYKSNNIYELLKLRSQYLDQAVKDEDIKLYMSELNRHIRHLEYEKFCIKNQFSDIYDTFYSRSKRKVQQNIEIEKHKLCEELDHEKYHQEIFSDNKKLRCFLKDEILSGDKNVSLDEAIFEMFGDIFNDSGKR